MSRVSWSLTSGEKTMAEDNDGIRLSRRKALAGLGSIGAATALGGVGTWAQLSDTEERVATFTAGGLDGEISWSGSYNGNHVEDGLDNVSVGNFTAQPSGIAADVHFEDVKPGDFGCVNFGITVQNNPAWVASCLNVESDVDYQNYEPEVEADGNITTANYDGTGQFDAQDADGAMEDGELAENILAIPYYDSDGTCDFFDESGTTMEEAFDQQSSIIAPGPFWSNSQGPAGTGNYLAPETLEFISNNIKAINTGAWNDGTSGSSFSMLTAPDGASVGTGCVILAGQVADDPSLASNNTRVQSPLHPGSTLNFGYDFHLPFDTGNVVQGDRLTLRMGFTFLQTRHTESPEFDEYSPGSNTPNN